MKHVPPMFVYPNLAVLYLYTWKSLFITTQILAIVSINSGDTVACTSHRKREQIMATRDIYECGLVNQR